MAEGVIIRKYFCHQCSTEITPSFPEYICPTCNGGFIEEVSEPEPPQGQGPLNTAAQFAELCSTALLGSSINFSVDALHFDQANQSSDGSNSVVTSAELDQQNLSGPSNPRHAFSMRVLRSRNPDMEGLINYFLSRIGSDVAMQGIPLNMFPIHGNLADYAWGSGGLDSVVTQLLNQLDNSGPPPAECDKIDSLPMVSITESQVDDVVQCYVCMEDFTLGEQVKRLPCDHHYHQVCIDTWLKMHGTCPVCRKDLNGKSTATDDPILPPPVPSSQANEASDLPSSAPSSNASEMSETYFSLD